MIGRILGAARLSAETYEEVEKDEGATLQALLVVVIVSIATVVGEVLAREENASLIGALGVGIVQGILSWALWAAVIWIIGSTILRGEYAAADWGGFARSIGFAHTPGVFNVLRPIPEIGVLLYLAVIIWMLAAMAVAVRQSLDYDSIWRAFFAVLLAAITVLIINIAFIAVTQLREEMEITLPFIPVI